MWKTVTFPELMGWLVDFYTNGRTAVFILSKTVLSRHSDFLSPTLDHSCPLSLVSLLT